MWTPLSGLLQEIGFLNSLSRSFAVRWPVSASVSRYGPTQLTYFGASIVANRQQKRSVAFLEVRWILEAVGYEY